MADYRPRLSAELTPEQAARLLDILPHGWQRPLFQVIVDGIIELYDRGGIDAISAIISKAVQIEQVTGMGHKKSVRDAMVKLKKLEEAP